MWQLKQKVMLSAERTGSVVGMGLTSLIAKFCHGVPFLQQVLCFSERENLSHSNRSFPCGGFQPSALLFMGTQ